MKEIEPKIISFDKNKTLLLIDYKEYYTKQLREFITSSHYRKASVSDGKSRKIDTTVRSAREQIISGLKLENIFCNLSDIIDNYFCSFPPHPHNYSSVYHIHYRKGDFYLPHYDSKFGQNSNNRKLTLVYFYKSDKNLLGGNLILHTKTMGYSFNIYPKQGRLCIFQSDVLHEVEKIHSGERESLICWLEVLKN